MGDDRECQTSVVGLTVEPKPERVGSPFHRTAEKDDGAELFQVDPWLVKSDFYHGYLPREDIVYLLKKHGDFLVRTSEVSAFVLEGSRWRPKTERLKVDTKSKIKKKETVVSVLIDPDGKFEGIPPTDESKQDMVRLSHHLISAT